MEDRELLGEHPQFHHSLAEFEKVLLGLEELLVFRRRKVVVILMERPSRAVFVVVGGPTFEQGFKAEAAIGQSTYVAQLVA